MSKIKFAKKVYLTTDINKDKTLLKYIKNNIHCYGIYIICIDENNDNLMNIYHSPELIKEYKRNKGLKIIGITSTKKRAFNLVVEIVKDHYNIYEDFNNFKESFLK